jgi:tetratricopeptide (TPR) repeat protein
MQNIAMDLNESPLESKARADDLYAKQEYLAAAEEYRRLTHGQPGNTVLMKQLGLALTLGQQVDEGVKTLQTAAAMQPADPEIRYAHGYALGMAGRFDEAIDELDAALNLQPNHIPARQGLIYCLLTSGQAIAQVNPVLGEQRLDRAYKLDPRNPHVAAANLDFMSKGNQKGKAVNFIKDLDSQAKGQSPLKDMIERLESDPEFGPHLRQASMAQRAAAPAVAPQGPGGSMKQVPCPSCRQPIMDYAAICPHCNARLRATGTFAGRDTGPAYEWQEIAYTIIALIWCALTGFQTYVTVMLCLNSKDGFSGPFAFLFIVAAAQFAVGLGLLFRQEWIAFIAKIVCYITLFTSAYGIMINFGLGRILGGLIDLTTLAVAGFLVYLINYVMGD